MNDKDTLPLYYLPGEVAVLLNRQRRRLRRQTSWLFAYLVLLAIPVRMTADWLVKTNPRFAFIAPMILPGMAAMAVFVLICGILLIFRKSY